MTNDGLIALEDELRAPVPDGLKRLSDGQLHELAGAIRDARHRQAQALTVAGENALGQLPRLLRGPIRKMFR